MKKVVWTTVLTLSIAQANAQYAPGDHWYDNPLGFKPLNLHTSMGILLPAVAVGACLLFTDENPEFKNKISIYNETGFAWGYKHPHTFLPHNNTGLLFQLRRFLSVGVEFDVYFPNDDFNSATGFAILPFARFYPINQSNWRIYFESGAGIVFFTCAFPQPTDVDNRLGTQWNGNSNYGVGAEATIRPNLSLTIGAKHIHVSNGDTRGRERNPSHDSNGIFVGLSYDIK